MESLQGQLVVLAILAALFVLGRELVCWYWKINQHLDGQKELAEEVRKLREELTAGRGQSVEGGSESGT